MPAYVIYINGWPGVGKLTVARHLQKLIPGSQVLHNHELIDPVEKRYPRGSAKYQIKRAEYRQMRLRPIMEDAKLKDTVFIFTDSQTEHNECVGDYTDLGLGERGRRFYSVVLHCGMEENMRRLTMSGRGGSLNGKLTDGEVLKEYRSRGSILRFGDDDEVEIDVTDIEPEEASRRVYGFVERREREGRTEVDWDGPDYSI
ncbi:hypothetical protein LTR37_014902 [Vermiconidia calcicola]|uniref:Uncharacterized protein n=1 Tax=Vermiconidia calcicola TaxID=1690605 RepID=A0ACC3MTE2_9PEZI|nr:hypothetical protein LTR37_014902 [Vermiconidia calcicola]